MILDRTYLQQTFPDLETRTVLRLMVRSISIIAPGTFEGLSCLQMLWLEENQLTQIAPDTFKGLVGLQYLHLDGNQLTQIAPDTFKGLAELQVVRLDGNQLTQIAPNTFEGLVGLRELDLGKNQLTHLAPGTFAGLVGLHTLLLDGNQLTHIAPGTFVGLVGLQELYLDGNLLLHLPPHALTARINPPHPDYPTEADELIEQMATRFPGTDLHQALTNVSELKKLSDFMLSNATSELGQRLILLCRYVHQKGDLDCYRFHSAQQLERAFHLRSKLALTASDPLPDLPRDVVRYLLQF